MKRIYSMIVVGALIFCSCNNDHPNGRDSDGLDGKDSSTNRQNELGTDSSGSARDTISATFSTQDSTFLVEALSGGVMEVRLGELAIKKSKQESTQELGKMMVQDHSKANEEIKLLIQQGNIQVKDSLSKKHQLKLNDFEKLKAADFDKKYIKEMQADHEKDISTFEKQLNATGNSSIKEFVGRTLPVLKKHQNHVETLVKEKV